MQKQFRDENIDVKAQRAFTLVELAIVLVIIGLLTAGVVGGQSLIRSAQLNKTATELNNYSLAMNAFELEYDAIPGDFKDASLYWSGATNGDGDKMIETSDTTYPTYSDRGNFDNEVASFFVHLKNAGIVSKPFDGTAVIGVGIPEIPSEKLMGMFVMNNLFHPSDNGSKPLAIDNYWTNGYYMHLMLCTGNANSLSLTAGNDCALFIPKDLKTIDTKIDDGIALSGALYGYGSSAAFGTNCLTVSNTYDLSRTERQCLASYKLKNK